VEVSVGKFKVHFYRCRNCGSTLVTPFKARYGEPYLCKLDHSFMTFLYTDTIGRRLDRVIYDPKPEDVQ